ncbi:transglutaminase-like domain-containing protein [Arcanobacterium wilhelmae]|uniref:transglutaminase-like domain-containing protein n=1 Tax=Arcanobacterium wilhelmae TaxID=1803177 RepID=UPI0024152E51|nr:transglutaminase-like domain-containing protein [Arcanobacterium wilhelmae]WFN90190.1 transglutaminase-like domain-containing protein [Arcanobacterium wilhelmae]
MKPKPRNVQNALVVMVLLALASVFHEDVFGGATGFGAAFGGAAVGALAAWISYLIAAGFFPTLMMATAGYFLFGTALALPQLGIYAVIPTPLSLKTLAVQAVTSWKDLLTLIPPASNYVGPSVLPYIVGLCAGLAAISATLRFHHSEWALMPIAAHALVGMAFSVRAGEHPVIGAVGGGIAMVWAAYLSFRRKTIAGELSVGDPSALMRRGFAGGTVMVVLALVAALVAAPALTGPRIVARNYIQPQIDLHDVPTPLANFRSYVDTNKDQVMFKVSGLKVGSRVRLAALDQYDGIIYSIGSPKGGTGFMHPHEPIATAPSGAETEKITIDVESYRGVWIPGGELLDVAFESPNATKLDASLMYSASAHTAVVMEGLTKGDRVTTTSLVSTPASDKVLAGEPVADIMMPPLVGVPEKVGAFARQIAADAPDAITAARTIEKYLHEEGYYSDPTSPRLGRPGHRAARINDMLNAPELIGDDEQYSVLMALMARSLGYPARVVAGFYPEKNPGGTFEIRGTDAHAWVEIAFAESGWVPFDPAPNRDQVLRTAVPMADPDPAPRVLQPPSPQKNPAEFQPEVADPQTPDEHTDQPTILWTVLGSLFVLIALLAPFVAIRVAKRLARRRLRYRPDVGGRIVGAWEDTLALARDAGFPIAIGTRTNVAEKLEEYTPDGEAGTFRALARAADAAIFSGHDMSQTEVDGAWTLNEAAKERLAANSRRSRIRRAISLAGLRRRK